MKPRVSWPGASLFPTLVDMRLLLLAVLLITVGVLLADVLIAVFYHLYQTTTPALLLAILLAWCLSSFALHSYQKRSKLKVK